MSDKPRVLVIEDDADMIELLTVILRRGGYEAVPALGGLEGLRKLEAEAVDLILLDLMMDDVSGWHVLEQIQEDANLRNIPVLIVSARHYLEDPAQAEAHAGQFEGYLVKPFVVHDLLVQIEESLA